MKPKQHLKTSTVIIQSTDGTIFNLNMVLNQTKLKLSLDPKSHFLWKTCSKNVHNKNYTHNFIQKFFSQN